MIEETDRTPLLIIMVAIVVLTIANEVSNEDIRFLGLIAGFVVLCVGLVYGVYQEATQADLSEFNGD